MTTENVKNWLVGTSKNVLMDGVLYEPRVYTDSYNIVNTDTNIIQGSPGNIFQNGEQFPVMLKWMTAFITGGGALDDTPADPRLLQRVGMRVRYHDQYYMSRNFAPIPLWHNTQTAAPAYTAPGTAAWDFDAPVVLSSRDSLQVSVASVDATVGLQVRAEVGFHGVGLLSRRPYFLQGTITLARRCPSQRCRCSSSRSATAPTPTGCRLPSRSSRASRRHCSAPSRASLSCMSCRVKAGSGARVRVSRSTCRTSDCPRPRL